MAAAGTAAGAGFYLLMSNLVLPSVALDASLLFVANPFLLMYSVVPFQEILLVAGLLFAFHFALTERWTLASLCLGAGCLTRYEGWLACPVLGAAYLRRTGPRPRAVLAAGFLVGWAPLGWIIFNRGLTPPGTLAVEWSLNPDRFVTSREAHVLVVGITVLAPLGLGALPRFRHAITALSVGTGLWMADRFVHRATAEPYAALSYQVARYLHYHMAPGEQAVVLARGFDAATWLAKLEEVRGPAAARYGLRSLRTLEMTPLDYQRILVQSGLGKDRLRSYATTSVGRFADDDTTRVSGDRAL